MKLPGSLTGGLGLFVIVFIIGLATPLYVLRKTRAFKATRIVQIRQEGSYNYVGIKVNGKVIIAMYDTGKVGDLSIPTSIASTIPGLTGTPLRTQQFCGVADCREGGVYKATVQIGDGPPISAEVDVGHERVLIGPRLIAASGYTVVLTAGNPRLVPTGMSTPTSADQIPLERDPGTTGPTHIPFINRVKINGKSVERMRYDTGASVSFLLTDEAIRLGIHDPSRRNVRQTKTITMQIGDTPPFQTQIEIIPEGFNTISTADAYKAGYTAVWSATGPALVRNTTTTSTAPLTTTTTTTTPVPITTTTTTTAMPKSIGELFSKLFQGVCVGSGIKIPIICNNQKIFSISISVMALALFLMMTVRR